MAATADAKCYYDYLFDADRQPTKVLDALLKGIAGYITLYQSRTDVWIEKIENIGDTSEKWLRPEKMAAFYQAVGGNYDCLLLLAFFVDIPPASISWIYASIGCQHILLPTEDSYDPPSIPSLTLAGFVRWQSIEILLGPEEHVPFIQKSLRQFDIRHPETNVPFPADLPTDAFPLLPDPVVEKWHESCAKLLQLRSRTPESKVFCRPSKLNNRNTSFSLDNSCQREDFSSYSKGYEQFNQKIRPKQNNFRLLNSYNLKSALDLNDLRLHEVAVEVDPQNASRRLKQKILGRNSFPSLEKSLGNEYPEIFKRKSGGDFSAQFDTCGNNSSFLRSRHFRHFDNEIISRLSDSTRHMHLEAETKPLARSLRPVNTNRFSASMSSIQSSRRKFSLNTEERYLEEYLRSKQTRNSTSGTIKTYERESRHLFGNRKQNKLRSIDPIFAIPDDTLLHNLHKSVRSHELNPDLDIDKS